MEIEMHQRLAWAVIDGEPEKEVGMLFASGEYSMPELIIATDAVKSALDILEPKLKGKVKVLIGGVPVTEGYAKEIGTDSYAKTRPQRLKSPTG
jgi:methanogenic corrinoid protein MtbC1